MTDYNEYISSEEWKLRAKIVRELHGHRCQLCNSNGKTLHVHHRTYDRLGHEALDDLTVLCKDCHSKFHEKVKKHQVSTTIARITKAMEDELQTFLHDCGFSDPALLSISFISDGCDTLTLYGSGVIAIDDKHVGLKQ